jgi:hypothetical protein
MKHKIRYVNNKLDEIDNKLIPLEDNEIKVDNLIDLNTNNCSKKIIRLDTEWKNFTSVVLEEFGNIEGRDIGYIEFSINFVRLPKRLLSFISTDISLSSNMGIVILKTESILEIYEDLENPNNDLQTGNIKIYCVIGFLNNSTLPQAKVNISLYNPRYMR